MEKNKCLNFATTFFSSIHRLPVYINFSHEKKMYTIASKVTIRAPYFMQQLEEERVSETLPVPHRNTHEHGKFSVPKVPVLQSMSK